VEKLDVIAQNQNQFRNQGVEIIQKLLILCKHRNQCRPVLSSYPTTLLQNWVEYFHEDKS
jgi:hypothetical protein